MVKMFLYSVVMVGASAREDAEAMLQSSQFVSVDADDKPVFAQTDSVALEADWEQQGARVAIRKHTPCNWLPHSADLNFDNAELVSNNLGGKGPNLQDQPEIRLSGIRTFASRPIDLVITANAAYEPKNPSMNGKNENGFFGKINVRSGKTAELTFTFQDHETKEATEMPDFYFTWADIDRSDSTHEALVLPAIERYFVAENHEVTVGNHEGSLSVSSTKIGHGCDDPTNPMELKNVECMNGEEVFQQRRAVMVEYKSRKDFKVILTASSDGSSNGGRNFLFAGRSNLAGNCPAPTTAAPTTAAPTTAAPTTAAPTTAAPTTAAPTTAAPTTAAPTTAAPTTAAPTTAAPTAAAPTTAAPTAVAPTAKYEVQDVCIHALGDKSATFQLPVGMTVSELIFTHKSGGLTCAKNHHAPSNFGCGEGLKGLVITEKDKKEVLMPLAAQKIEGFERTSHGHSHWYTIQGVGAKTEKMPWKFGTRPKLSAGTYEVWYSEDLSDKTEGDNAGEACYDIKIFR